MEKQKQELLELLRPMLTTLSTFIDEGVQIAKDFFSKHGSPPTDPWLFSHLVRWHICRRLDESKDLQIRLERIDYPLSGIEISHEGRRFKIFKSSNGELPAAGTSGSRQEFWNRNLFEELDTDVFNARNLALIWDLDAKFSINLQLACPRKGDIWKSGQQLWALNIPYPWVVSTATDVNTGATELPLGEQQEEGKEDLDIASGEEGTEE